MTIEDMQAMFAALAGIIVFWAPLVTGITEALKRIRPSLPTEAYPAIALPLSLAAGWYYIAPGQPQMAALYGVAIWLSSMGLYSGGKAVLGKS